LSTNVTPLGKLTPPRVRLGIGKPVGVTVKVPLGATVNVVALALLIAGASRTVKVKAYAGEEHTTLVAVKVRA